MIEKISGRVAYAVMSFGGFLGMGTEEHAIPWNKLTYDTSLGGYSTVAVRNEIQDRGTISAPPCCSGIIIQIRNE
jgi:PRC-barrel domain